MNPDLHLHFHGELNDFLPPSQRHTTFQYAWQEPRSVKDLVESLGVPHTEIDLIIINRISVGFDYRLQPGDNINLYGAAARRGDDPRCDDQRHDQLAGISPLQHCQPAVPAQPRFILDVHLGRLAAYLRMLGFDTLYRNDYDDPTLADISAGEQRILLTCDRRLLMRSQVSLGYFVRARQPRQQLQEVVSRFQLYEKQQPFTRCMHCNGETRAVAKQEIADQLEAKTRKYYDEFFQCRQCKKIYWKGSHYLRMQALIRQIK